MPRLEHFKRLGAEEIPRYRKFYCYDDGETLILLALKDNWFQNEWQTIAFSEWVQDSSTCERDEVVSELFNKAFSRQYNIINI